MAILPGQLGVKGVHEVVDAIRNNNVVVEAYENVHRDGRITEAGEERAHVAKAITGTHARELSDCCFEEKERNAN